MARKKLSQEEKEAIAADFEDDGESVHERRAMRKAARDGQSWIEKLNAQRQLEAWPLPPVPYEQVKRAGKPTTYTPEHAEMAFTFLSNPAVVMTVRAMTLYLGIHVDTHYAWMEKHKEYSDAVRAGLQAQETALAHRLTYQKNAQGIIFALKNMHSDFWKDKTETDHTFNLGKVVQATEAAARPVAWTDLPDTRPTPQLQAKNDNNDEMETWEDGEE